jgi:hypothetical protein
MNKAEGEMRAGYKRTDFTKLERGKYYKEVAGGTTVVLLDSALAKAFPTSESVTQALHGLLAIATPATSTKRRAAPVPRKRTAG